MPSLSALDWVQPMTAIGTLSLALIAAAVAIVPAIRNYRRQPRLQCFSGHCLPYVLRWNPTQRDDCDFKLRLHVENLGTHTAHGVRAYVSDARKRQPDESWGPSDPVWDPQFLVVANPGKEYTGRDRTTLPSITRGIPGVFDIASFHSNLEMHVTVDIPKQSRFSVLQCGAHELDVTVAADDARPVKCTIAIDFSGYDQDPAKMLGTLLKVAVQERRM
jgi:hypothetical protein